MAPFKKIKTYQNPKKQRTLNKSDVRMNDLLTNLTNIGISPETTYNTLRETTFDRLLRGQHYNDIVFVNCPRNISSSGELSYSILDYTKNKTREDVRSSKTKNIEPVQTPDSSKAHILKSSYDRSPIITRSKLKFHLDSNIQSDIQKNTSSQSASNLKETRTNCFQSSSITKNSDSEINASNFSTHISLKQSNSSQVDKFVENKKFQNHLHLNMSGFKFELLRNKGSTPLLPKFAKIEKRKTKNKLKSLRSIEYSICNASIKENFRRLKEEENTSHSKRHTNMSFVKKNISNLSNSKYEKEKIISLSTESILKDNTSTQKYEIHSESIETCSRRNISCPTTSKTIERNKIIQDWLSTMACSSLQTSENKSEHSRIFNNQQNYISFQNSSLSNPHLVLTSTPLHKNKSIEIIDLSSDNETEVLKKFNYDKSSTVQRELPSCSFIDRENGTNEQNKNSDKIDPTNKQIELQTCSKPEENLKQSENDSKNDDFVDSSITAQQPIMKKFVSLAAGKKFRRSIIIHKNTMDSSKDLKRNVSNTTKYSKPRRTSIKVVPVTTMKATLSGLENYAANFSFQQEASINIKNSFDELLPSVNVNLTNQIKQAIIPTSARNIVLQRCGQTEPLNFEKCYPPSVLKHCQKIGEGVYGEVFMYRDENSSLTVMKIIPIEGDKIVNLEKQKTFEEIISEIIISAELSNLRMGKGNKTDAFTEVKKIRCVQGSYPQRLLELWDLYDENKHSENDSPEIFQSDQLYIVLELSNGGRDLEAFQFKNAQQALAVFKQTACAIAVAEEELHFEHRDLHWGNVLVEVTTQEFSNFTLKEKEIAINNKDVKATIIDFTLSRIEYDGVVIFNDLALDSDLFSATGDYQFEVYRLMQKNNGNEWQSFKPYSNVLWLHYILDKAITAFRYKNIKSKLHKTSINTLKAYKQKILNYRSVSEFVMNDFVS